MNPISTLQLQFPLSPRKFWKKMLPKLVGFIFIPLIFLGIIFPFFFFASGSQKTDIGITLLFAVIGGLILYLMLVLPYAWYVKTYIKRYYYSGEEHFITIKKGVFAPAEIHVQWQKIQDVYVDQDILDRIMGLYDVHIASATAASAIEAHIDGVDQAAAEGLKQFLLNKVSNAGRNIMQNNGTVPLVSEQSQGQQPRATVPVPPKIKLSEEISSNTYPLSAKWTVVALLGRIIGAFISPGILILFFIVGIKNSGVWDYWLYVILGWLALSVLTIIVRTITLFLWKKNYAFNFTPDNIYYRQGVISLSEKHMPYSSIQDVSVQQGVIERMVGLAKVRIENAAQAQVVQSRRGPMSVFSGVLIQGLSVADANKITNILKTTVLGKNTTQYGL